MLDITAANTANLPTVARPAAPKTYRLRKEAQCAAVAAIGPHAREGFEFTTEKCDGRWGWRETDEVRPPTGAELKAMGGRKGLLSLTMAANALGGSLASHVAGALVDSASPAKRTSEAPAGVAEPSSEDEAVQQAGEAVTAAALALHEERGRERAAGEGRLREPEDDPSGVPGFLRRENTPEVKKRVAKIVTETNPRTRKIKSPPDAKMAKAKADAQKKTSIAFVARSAILAGKTNEQALAEVVVVFPKCPYKPSDMQWQRRKLVKDGLINKDGSASAAGKKWLAGK
jgi:hypothetical protein